jgi:hypothetical protein
MAWRSQAWAVFVVLAIGAPALLADEAYERLLASFEAAQQKWVEQTRDLKKGRAPPRHPTRTFLPKFRAYARKHAGKPDAIPALVWLIDATRTGTAGQDLQPVATWAIEALRRDHAASPALGPVMADLRNAVDTVSCEKLAAFYERVRQKNPDPEIQAAATFNLAYALWIGDPGLPAASARRTAEKKRADELFCAVMRDYPGSPLAEEAEGFLKQLKYLEVGLPALEIVGRDPNDKEIRLSQYKGRVVALVFWGFW